MPSSSPGARLERFSHWKSRIASCKSATKALRGMMCMWVQFRKARRRAEGSELSRLRLLGQVRGSRKRAGNLEENKDRMTVIGCSLTEQENG